MLCVYTAHFYVSKKDTVPTVIPVQILSKGAQGQCFMIGRDLLYHTKLLSTAELEVQDCKTDMVDTHTGLSICICVRKRERELVCVCVCVCTHARAI
jgi:hypothetical protein